MSQLATVGPPEPAAVIMIPPGGPHCDVLDCDLPAKADMVWYDSARGELHLQQVCARCTFLFKDYLPALWFPLDRAPALEYLAQEVMRYQARRPGVYVRSAMPFNGNVHWSTNMNGGTTSSYFTW